MNRFELVRIILGHLGIDPARFSVEWVSAAEGIRFVQVITDFDSRISELGPFGVKETLDPDIIRHKLNAAMMAVDRKMFRMAFARQAKQMKENGTYGRFPSKEKLLQTFMREMMTYETLSYLDEKERTAAELAGLLGVSEDRVMAFVDTLKKKNMWDGEIRIKD
jgi:hypothetical protein